MAALSAELETPLNVHRWRKLEGTDPSRIRGAPQDSGSCMGDRPSVS